MRDLNFFEPYIHKKHIKFSKQSVLCIIVCIAFMGLSGQAIYNQILISKTNTIIDQLSIMAQEPSVVEKVKDLKAQEDEVKLFKLELEKIKNLNTEIENTDFINEKFLTSITSKMPVEIFLTSLKISTKEINISGVSKYKISVAEFKKGLEKIEKFEDIFISHIIRDAENYRFDISCILEEVPSDAGKVEDME